MAPTGWKKQRRGEYIHKASETQANKLIIFSEAESFDEQNAGGRAQFYRDNVMLSNKSKGSRPDYYLVVYVYADGTKRIYDTVDTQDEAMDVAQDFMQTWDDTVPPRNLWREKSMEDPYGNRL